MDKKIAIIGLGYVGLPLAVEFAKNCPAIGLDVYNLFLSGFTSLIMVI